MFIKTFLYDGKDEKEGMIVAQLSSPVESLDLFAYAGGDGRPRCDAETATFVGGVATTGAVSHRRRGALIPAVLSCDALAVISD